MQQTDLKKETNFKISIIHNILRYSLTFWVTYCTKVSLERKSKILLLQHLSTQSSAFDITYCKEKKLAHKFSFLKNTGDLRRKKGARALQHTPHTPLSSEFYIHTRQWQTSSAPEWLLGLPCAALTACWSPWLLPNLLATFWHAVLHGYSPTLWPLSGPPVLVKMLSAVPLNQIQTGEGC